MRPLTKPKERGYTTAKVQKNSKRVLQCLSAVSYAELGWDKRCLRTIFFALIRSNLDYRAPGWQPFEALRREADITNYATTRKRIVLKGAKKAR